MTKPTPASNSSTLEILLRQALATLARIETKLDNQEVKVAELDDLASTLSDQVDTLTKGLTDFKTDFDAAIAKLQTGQPVDPATLQKLKDMGTKLTAISSGLKDLDTTAEGISGVATP